MNERRTHLVRPHPICGLNFRGSSSNREIHENLNTSNFSNYTVVCQVHACIFVRVLVKIECFDEAIFAEMFV